MDDKARKKFTLIEQMLKKAESTTPEEAEALLEAAAKLMARYGVTEAMLRASGEKKMEDIVRRSIHCTGANAKQLMILANTICHAGGVTRATYVRHAANDYRVSIFGYESDAEATVLLVQSVFIQALNAMRAWHKQETKGRLRYADKTQRYNERCAFLIGYAHGVQQKIKDAVTAAKQEYDGNTGSALVLRDRGKQVDEYVEARGVRKTNLSGPRGSDHAITAGYLEGQNANINQKAVSA